MFLTEGDKALSMEESGPTKEEREEEWTGLRQEFAKVSARVNKVMARYQSAVNEQDEIIKEECDKDGYHRDIGSISESIRTGVDNIIVHFNTNQHDQNDMLNSISDWLEDCRITGARSSHRSPHTPCRYTLPLLLSHTEAHTEADPDPETRAARCPSCRLVAPPRRDHEGRRLRR